MSDPIARARSLSSVADAAALYAEWASTYDDEVFGLLGFTGSTRIAELLADVMPEPNRPVIDLGCGTGAVGRRLAELGVTTVDGVDLSPEMLSIAERTGVYRNLIAADLNAPPALLVGSYAASVSAGTFSSGHVGPDAVAKMLEMLRPGGLVAWVIAASLWADFEPVLISPELRVVHQAVEPIRKNAPPEAVMFVAQRSGKPA